MLPDLTNDPRWAIPVREKSPFMAANTKEREAFMAKDLAASGLKSHMVRSYVDDLMDLGEGAKGGYYLPYFDLDGRLMRHNGELSMYRIRQWGGKNRYTQPSRSKLEELFLPVSIPYILPQVHEYAREQRVLYVCEGEKKAASVCHYLDVGAIGIGGCWCWGVKKKLHPWIKEILGRYGVERVVVVPDGDIQRYDICTAYGTLADELRQLGIEVEIVRLPLGDDKIDDLIMEWGPTCKAEFAALGKLGADRLVVSQATLAEQYGLSTVGKEAKIMVNDSNVYKLLEHHPAFGEFWLNTDTSTVMMDDTEVRWEITDNQITRHMQHYFQMHNLTVQRVSPNICSLAEENKRSPFLDWVQGVAWDGVERLATWPIRLWGCKDSVQTREVASKFMVGMCARLVDPGCKMDWMLVTVGAQGIGKSWWADLVSGGQFVSFMSSGNARDDAAKMHRGLIVLIDELDAFNKREMTYWKTMITTHVDTYRAPYARKEVTMPRSSVLYGTSNQKTFLRHDATGHRRFGVLEPGCMLDVEGLRGELQQLWAEAMHVYESGGLAYYELSRETQEAVRDEHSAEDPLEQSVYDFLCGWPDGRFKMIDLLRNLGMENQVQARGVTGPLKDMMLRNGWCEYKKKIMMRGKGGIAGYIINREACPMKKGSGNF